MSAGLVSARAAGEDASEAMADGLRSWPCPGGSCPATSLLAGRYAAPRGSCRACDYLTQGRVRLSSLQGVNDTGIGVTTISNPCTGFTVSLPWHDVGRSTDNQ